MCMYLQGVYLQGVSGTGTPRALTHFFEIYETSVAKIDVNWLVELVDLVQWDDIGPRVWERAVATTSVPLRDLSKVKVRRGLNHVRQRNAHDDEPASIKQSLSSSNSLHTQPWIASWGKLWYDWHEHDQHPDAVFTLRLTNENDPGSVEEEILLCYECDADSKADKRKEMRKVVMKMWQAVDAARWTRHGHPKREQLSAYTVRCNVFKAIKLDEPDAVKRGLAWLHRIMSAHIFSFLLIVEDWLASRLKTKAPDDNWDGLPRFKDKVMDHHLFIGLFSIPPSSCLHLAHDRAWQKHQTKYTKWGSGGLLSPEKFDGSSKDGSIAARPASYVSRDKKSEGKNVFNNDPLPLVEGPNSNQALTFGQKFKRNWQAQTTIKTWESYDVRVFSVERVNMEKVYTWLTTHDRSTPEFYDTTPSGAWYVTDVRQFLLHYYRSDPVKLNLVFANIHRAYSWDMDINKRIGNTDPKKNSIKLAEDATAVLVQNAMTELETALLGAFKTDSGWGVTMLSWDVPPYQRELKSESLTFDKGPLIAIKEMLRDNPTLLRHRYASKHTKTWEEYNKRNGTLRSACYVQLTNNLPQLTPEVEKYLDTFQVPNAKLFFRLVRCNSILALRELARQFASKRMETEVLQYLKTLDVCVQSEVNLIFDQVRDNLDVYVDNDEVREITKKGFQHDAEHKPGKRREIDVWLDVMPILGINDLRAQLTYLHEIVGGSAQDVSFDREIFNDIYNLLYTGPREVP